MPAEYQVRVYDTSGNLQAVTDRFRALSITHQLNTPSTLTLSFYELDPVVQYIDVLDAIVEVRRRFVAAGLGWYTEYVGFHRTPQRQITTTDARIYTSYSRGLLDLLRRRTIRYFADTAGSAKGPGPADDMMKQYVRENASTAALAALGRVTDGVLPGLSVQANASLAPSWSGAGAWKNLLDFMREIGGPNRVDFDVVWLGGVQFEFRTYYPQKGTDRRLTAVFSPAFGNMSNPSYTRSRTDEISSVLVLGVGDGPLRDTTLRTNTHTADSPWNLIEQNQEASGEDRADALAAIGDAVLFDKRPAAALPFDIIQTPQSAYGMHYALGDIVNARFSTVSVNVKITGVTATLSDTQAASTEQIRLDMQEVFE